MRWGIFAAVFLAQILVTAPSFMATCRRGEEFGTKALYLAHHAFDVYLFWAFLFLTRRVEFVAHIAIAVLVAIHWFTYGNKCIATVELNRQCGYPESEWLDSFKNRLGLRVCVGENFHFLWIGGLVAWEVLRLSQA